MEASQKLNFNKICILKHERQHTKKSPRLSTNTRKMISMNNGYSKKVLGQGSAISFLVKAHKIWFVLLGAHKTDLDWSTSPKINDQRACFGPTSTELLMALGPTILDLPYCSWAHQRPTLGPRVADPCFRQYSFFRQITLMSTNWNERQHTGQESVTPISKISSLNGMGIEK